MARAGDKITFPTVKKNDPEDVSWALSTAEAMWNRGDQVEAVKWIRRAAEAASECDADTRALELAKVAAEFTQQIENGERPTRVAPPPSTMKTGSPAVAIALAAPSPPAPPVQPMRGVAPAARPPPPKTGGPHSGKAPALPRVPSLQPLKHTMPSQAQPRQPDAEPAPASRKSDPRGKSGRKSHANLVSPPAQEAADPVDLNRTAEVRVLAVTPEPRRRGRSRPASDEVTGTLVPLKNPILGLNAERSAGGDPDQWPTASSSSGLGEVPSEERTSIETAAHQEAAKAVSSRDGPVTESPSAAPTRTTQAVRVWLYRNDAGVHVAPAGAVVDAAVVEAMLVALDPTTDLAMWFQTAVRSK